MPESYESQNEYKHLEADLVDRIRHEIAWEINRYVRRMKDDAIAYAKTELAKRGGHNVDLRTLAVEAVGTASGGMFLSEPEKPLEAVKANR